MAEKEWIELTVYQGDPAVITTTALDADDNPIDLTAVGADAQFNMGRDWGDTTLIQYQLSDAAMTGSALGVITVTLAAADTTTRNEAHRYVFTVWAKAADEDLRVVAIGQLNIHGTVRRSA